MLNCINKKIRLRIAVIFISMICAVYVKYSSTVATYTTPVKGEIDKIILIDPGHGGIDGGAKSKRGCQEKHINLSISLKLRDKLKNMGYEVVMTRDSDKGLYGLTGSIRNKKNEDLNNRCKMKRDSSCDVFISIHQNFFEQSYYYGAQVWYSKNEDSEKLAHIIQENFKIDLDKKNNRVEKPAGNAYKVLRCHSDIPSVIVECGFLTNPQEEEKLKSEEYQNKIADSLAKSVKEYFDTEGQRVLSY